MGSSVGVLSVISRSSVGVFREGIREVKETAILRKVLFSILEFLGSSLVRPWFIFGLLHGAYIQGTRERNLKNCTSVGCRVYGVKAGREQRSCGVENAPKAL